MQTDPREASTVHITTAAAAKSVDAGTAVFTASKVDVSYSGKLALHDVDMTIYANRVTAFIGPSGCGKSTYIRCFNRMNDLIPGAEVRRRGPLSRSGPLRSGRRPGPGSAADRHGLPEAESRSPSRSTTTSPTGRACIGMTKATSTSVVERSLRQAALWDEVKDRLEGERRCRSRADSSSASASRARSRSSPTCSSWTSRARRSIRSRRRASRI